MFTNWGNLGWLPCKPIARLKAKIRKHRSKTYLDHGTRTKSKQNDTQYEIRKYGVQHPLHIQFRGI